MIETGVAGRESTRATVRSGNGYAWYVVAVLFVVNCFNAMDRSIVTILVEPIRKELGLNDTQIGFITGLGYALVYAVMSLVIARTVDRGNRRNALTAGVAFWSIMTVATGYAVGMASMLAARAGIAAGEATYYPNTLSLIGDYFPRAARPRAISLIHLGNYGGIILGVTTAGVIAEHYGWRAAFHVLGLPGLVLAAILFLTVREPLRGMNDDVGQRTPSLDYGGMAAMWRMVASDARFALLVTASVLMAIAQVTMGSWMAAFVMRVHGVGQQEVGLLTGPVVGLSGIAGTLIGGLAGSWLAQRRSADERAPLLVMLVSAPLAVPSLLLFLFAPSLSTSMLGAGLSTFFIAMHFAPLVAVTIGMVGSANRGVASSVLVIGQFLIGFGFGPLIVGWASDTLQPTIGGLSLRYAMLLAPLVTTAAWGTVFVTYRRWHRTNPT